MTSTDTNQASELYELYRDVYKRTGWGDTTDYVEERLVNGELVAIDVCKNVGYEDDDGVFGGVQRKHFPLYTSDYLLEKLPRSIKRYGRFELVPTMRNTRWSAGYWTGDRLDTLSVVDYTPLKTLLKLTIALSEVGEFR